MCVFPSSLPLFLLSLFFLFLLVDPIQNLPWVIVWVTLCRASIHPFIQLFVSSPSYSLIIYPSTHTSIHLLVYYPASQSLICIHWYIHLSVFLASQTLMSVHPALSTLVECLFYAEFSSTVFTKYLLICVWRSPWGRWGSDATELFHFHFSLSCIGEGNGNPLQCSCLENPRDRGAWWAAIYGVA